MPLQADVIPNLALAAQTYGAPQRNLSVEGRPMRIAGVAYAKGIGTHASSEIPLHVPDGATALTGAVGVDDEVGAGRGSLRFRVLSGSEVLWESPLMNAGDTALPFRVIAAGRTMLYLQTDAAGSNEYDHADWVDLAWQQGKPAPSAAAREFDGAAFGLRPDVPGDQCAAFRKALRAMQEAPGSTLRLQRGTYNFHASGALPRHFHISNHDQPEWHPVALPLVNLHGATIDGNGSTLLMHGSLLPVLVMDSESVTLRRLAIDYAIPHHAQGMLTAVNDDAYEVTIDAARHPHRLEGGWFVFEGDGWQAPDRGAGIVFSGRTGEIVAGTSDFNFRGPASALGDGRYRVVKNLAAAGIRVGDFLTFRLGARRPHPAVTLYRAKDTRLEDCRIHASEGMGLLAQRSENVTMLGGGVIPSAGRVFSTSADATHFSNCKGLIRMENARFSGMMDDAINVHATCLRIVGRQDARTLRCRYMHGQSVGFETFLPGESLRFIKARWLTPTNTVKVLAVTKLSTTECLLALDQDAPDDIQPGDAVENADWFPSVVFRSNDVRHNRARGALFTTPRSILVEDNTFERVAGSAILLAGDANGWYESGACEDVRIRRNRFHDNLTSRFQFTNAILSIYPEVPDLDEQKSFYHRNIRITDNEFETFDVPLLFAISTRDLVFEGNKVTYNDNYPAWRQPPFQFDRCKEIQIRNNTVSRAGTPLNWTERDANHRRSTSIDIR